MYLDSTRQFGSAVCRREIQLSEPASSLALISKDSMFVTLKSSKLLCRITLPSAEEQVQIAISVSLDVCIGSNFFFTPDSQCEAINVSDLNAFPGHELGKAHLQLSYHQKWLVTGAADGRIILRLIEVPVSNLGGKPWPTCKRWTNKYDLQGGNDLQPFVFTFTFLFPLGFVIMVPSYLRLKKTSK